MVAHDEEPAWARGAIPCADRDGGGRKDPSFQLVGPGRWEKGSLGRLKVVAKERGHAGGNQSRRATGAVIAPSAAFSVLGLPGMSSKCANPILGHGPAGGVRFDSCQWNAMSLRNRSRVASPKPWAIIR